MTRTPFSISLSIFVSMMFVSFIIVEIFSTTETLINSINCVMIFVCSVVVMFDTTQVVLVSMRTLPFHRFLMFTEMELTLFSCCSVHQMTRMQLSWLMKKPSRFLMLKL